MRMTSWPLGDSEMARRIRVHDWTSTSLGSAESWSGRLKVMVETVLANPEISCLVCGPERILIYNDAAARLYGTLHPLALGQPLPRTFPEGWATVAPLYARAFGGEAIQAVAQPLDTRGEGAATDIFDTMLLPVRDDTGAVAAVYMSGQEIGGRVRAEAALRESEERLRGFGDASQDVLWIRDADTLQWEYLTPAFETIYGVSREEALRADNLSNWAELVLPEDRAHSLASIRQVGQGHRVTFECRIRRPSDGQVRWLRETDFPMRDAAGRVRWIGGVGQDVTMMKEAEAALACSESRLRTLVEGMPQLLWRSAAHGEWTWASPQWTAFTGLSDEASRGRGWLQALHPDDQAGASAAWDRVGEDDVFQADYRLRHAGSGLWRWFQTRSLPVHSAHGGGTEWLGTSTDVEDQVRARDVLAHAAEKLEASIAERTAELQAAEASLLQSQKMEAVGQLTGGIAHDFNNMLQGVAGGVEMARRRISAGQVVEAEGYLQVVREAADRAAGLTRRLLAFARRQRLEPKPVDADALVAGMADLIRRTIGPGIALELRLRNSAGAVLCDPNELENVLLNLCINARDAMPNGGRLTLCTEDVSLTAKDIPGGEVTPGRYVELMVADTGTGMSPEVLARMFDPFFTTKPQGQGTGLGLSQVWGFVRQSGGLVRAASELGRGTTFHLLLPFRAWVAEAAGSVAELAPLPSQPGMTVLLVDDEDAVRGPAADRLRELGYTVLEARDGPDTLRILAISRPSMLVTDIGLPGGMNGRQVAEAARERWPELPVLFITGYAGSTVLPPGVKVIGKPFTLDDLARRVASILKVEFRKSDRDPGV